MDFRGLLLILLQVLSLCGATEYYVRPTEPTNTSCPGQPCLTINQYTNDSDHYFKSNTVFKFLLGTHELAQPVALYNVENISLQAYIYQPNDTGTYPVLLGKFSDSLLDCTLGLRNILYNEKTEDCAALLFDTVHNVTLRGLGIKVMLQNALGIAIIQSSDVYIQTI